MGMRVPLGLALRVIADRIWLDPVVLGAALRGLLRVSLGEMRLESGGLKLSRLIGLLLQLHLLGFH